MDIDEGSNQCFLIRDRALEDSSLQIDIPRPVFRHNASVSRERYRMQNLIQRHTAERPHSPDKSFRIGLCRI